MVLGFDPFYINIITLIITGILLLLTSGLNNKANLLLSFAMFNAAYVFIAVYSYIKCNYELYLHLHPYNVAAVLFLYPSFNQYLQYITPDKRFKYKMFLPGVIIGILSAIIYYVFLDYNERLYFFGQYRLNKTTDSFGLQLAQVFRIINLVVLFVQMFWCFYNSRINLKRYQEYLNDTISNPWIAKINRARVFNILFVIMGLLTILFYSVNPAKLFGTNNSLLYPFYFLALVFVLIGAAELNRKYLNLNVISDTSIDDCSNISDEKLNSDKKKLKTDLLNYIESFKPYINPGLTINDLVNVLGTNRSYLSSVINSEFGVNFAGFINQYRFKMAEQLIIKNPNETLDSIALQSGFGSLASFNRAVHQFTGMSPREFKKSVLQSA